MNELEYKKFYERVGAINGWDFSKVKCVSEGAAWDFYEEVSKRCSHSDHLLDIGTGGGEALLTIAEYASHLVGIDNSAGMIETAKTNLRESGTTNVHFLRMDAKKLNFPDGHFQIVTCRHSPFCTQEVARVLVKGGLFLTQQVSEGDKINVKQAFGRNQSASPDGTLMNQYMNELRACGFTSVQCSEYDATEYYETYEDLLFLLKHTPTIPNFGEDEHDFEILDRYIKENQTSKGIETNAKRSMIIAQK
ncbi:class I SAM-dependent methyltransferase [Paenibacillus dakarensis]|uniref:class I SAM-dependent methyltransferase n=1 Tax=Paenibacillus dakarensis TaxID=1527293 RepID=UPI0006D5A960|nr:class I SAM-dependent methyltransferase [Paenibacillus dakarensis]